MNKNSNVYIIIYASVMIIIVAVLLSVASMALKSRQQANIAVEKQGAILSTIGLGGDADKVKDKTKYIEQEYEKYITDSYVVNGEGDRVEGAAAFGLLDKLKDEYAKPQAERQLPVFVARLDDGTVLNVLAVYGAGLWGPIWGYIALGSDWDTIRGAVFDHQGETPGLGAEITRTVHRQDHIRRRGVYRNSGAQRGRCFGRERPCRGCDIGRNHHQPRCRKYAPELPGGLPPADTQAAGRRGAAGVETGQLNRYNS